MTPAERLAMVAQELLMPEEEVAMLLEARAAVGNPQSLCEVLAVGVRRDIREARGEARAQIIDRTASGECSGFRIWRFGRESL